MEIPLDRASTFPVYRQIASELNARIESGELVAGERLPPIRRLAEQLGVNRDTVALAYDELAGTGAITARVGRGTFVGGARASERGVRITPALSNAAEQLIEFTAYGNLMHRAGNRCPGAAPQGLYPCRDHSPQAPRWLALSVATDPQWEALVKVLDIQATLRVNLIPPHDIGIQSGFIGDRAPPTHADTKANLNYVLLGGLWCLRGTPGGYHAENEYDTQEAN